MYTRLFTPPVTPCAAALDLGSELPPACAEEVQRPSYMSNCLVHLRKVLLEQGLDTVKSDESTVINVLHEFYLRYMPENNHDARTRGLLRASIECFIAQLQRLSCIELTSTDSDEVSQVIKAFAERMLLEDFVHNELEQYAMRLALLPR